MANNIIKTLKRNSNTKILVLMGKGHCEFGFGVPERVLNTNKK